MPSSQTDVTRALLSLNDDPQIPFSVHADDNGTLIAEWPYINTSSRSETYRLKVTLMPETSEYKASSLTIGGLGHSGAPIASTWKFSTFAVTKPVYAVLTEHGWTRKKGFFGKLFS